MTTPVEQTELTDYGAKVVLERHFPGITFERQEGLGVVTFVGNIWEFELLVSVTTHPMNYVEAKGDGLLRFSRKAAATLPTVRVRSLEETEAYVIEAAKILNGVIALIDSAFQPKP